MKIKPVILCIVLGILCGCSTSQISARLASNLLDGQYRSIQEEADVQLAERAIPASLKMMEGLLKDDPQNSALLVKLSEGFCGYAFSFLEDEDPGRALAMYLRGRDYSAQALAVQTGGTQLTGLGHDELSARLKTLGESELPALFWLGQCWGGWLMHSLSEPEALADISKVQSLIERMLEIDAGYHYGGPHLLAGAFYGGRSKLLGGDAERARSHFEASLKETGGRFLIPRVLYARTVAVQTQDRELFETQLRIVLDADAGALAQQRLANEVARIKALKLLESADELF